MHQQLAKPRIYCFSDSPGDFDCIARAMAEDGTILVTVRCSHPEYIYRDLGLRYGFMRPDLHAIYAAHYPQGYELELVSWSAAVRHDGFKAAMKLSNQKSQKLVEANL